MGEFSLTSTTMRPLLLLLLGVYASSLVACSAPQGQHEARRLIDEQRLQSARAWLAAPNQTAWTPSQQTNTNSMEGLPTISITMIETLDTLKTVLALDYGVSISYPEEHGQRVVSVVWDERNLGEALNSLAGQLDLELVRRGDRELELSQAKRSDVQSIVLPSGYDNATTMKRALDTVVSDVGRTEDVGERIVVSDVPSRLEAIAAVHERLSQPRGQWLLEVKFIDVAESAVIEYGLDWRLGGQGVFTFDLEGGQLTAQGELLATLLAAAQGSDDDVRMLAKSSVFVIDGRSARSEYGEETPVPLRSTSPEGTTRTERYEIVSTGIILDASLRELPDGSALVHLVPEISSVTGFVDDAPVVALSRVEVDAILRPGSVLLVSGLESVDTRDSSNGLPDASTWLTRRTTHAYGRRSVYVVVRAHKVNSLEVGPRSAAEPTTAHEDLSTAEGTQFDNDIQAN